MRVTQNALTRNYLFNMNKTLDETTKSNNRLTSGRKFTKISEDISSGITALKTREKLYKSQQMQENIKVADEELKVTETNLMAIKDIADAIHDSSIKLQNDTNQQERETFAVQFDTYKDQIISLANCQYNDKYTLGGTNGSDIPPFTMDDKGVTYFNGVEISKITKNADAEYVTDAGIVPQSEEVYLDIGLGVKFIGGNISPKSAFKVSVSGLECLGYGTSTVNSTGKDGVARDYEVPNNLCDILTGMSQAIRDNDMDKFAAYEVNFKAQTDKLVTNVSEIGIRTNFLESNLERMENEEFLLTEKHANLEGVEDSKELINYKSMEYAWMLTLQYGSKVIPQSLMDFIK